MDQKTAGIIAVVVVVLVAGGIAIYYSSQQPSSDIAYVAQEEIQISPQEPGMSTQSAKMELEKAAAETEKAQQQAQAQADSLQVKIKELIAKAKSYLQDGNYDQAIKVAQQVLTNFDPSSSEAKSIIQQAKDGLAKLAQEKMSQDPAGAVQGAVGSMMGK